jgi:hypothetical protein
MCGGRAGLNEQQLRASGTGLAVCVCVCSAAFASIATCAARLLLILVRSSERRVYSSVLGAFMLHSTPPTPSPTTPVKCFCKLCREALGRHHQQPVAFTLHPFQLCVDVALVFFLIILIV